MAALDKRVLVTGADGFVGRTLCKTLRLKGYPVRAAVRTSATDTEADSATRTETVPVGSITAETDWTAPLDGVEVVVHLASRTHITHEATGDVLAAYRQINVEATERLARMAAASGVKRLIFMSSVKVNGERTFDHSFTEIDMPQPVDAYGISKWEAEQAVARIAKETGLEFVVVRSPLVYGPRVKGNFLRLMRLIAGGTPLPLASVTNRRSLIYVGNLVDAIVACMEAPAAAGKTYLVSDGEDVSTTDLIHALADALGVPARLFPFPGVLLKFGATMLSKGDEVARPIGSLQVDSTQIQNELGWRPRFTLTEGLEQTARWYRRMTGDE